MTDENNDNRPPGGSAGGIFLAIFLLAGAGLGIYCGQPSLGLLIGLGAGIIVLALQWAITRSRR